MIKCPTCDADITTHDCVIVRDDAGRGPDWLSEGLVSARYFVWQVIFLIQWSRRMYLLVLQAVLMLVLQAVLVLVLQAALVLTLQAALAAAALVDAVLTTVAAERHKALLTPLSVGISLASLMNSYRLSTKHLNRCRKLHPRYLSSLQI
jgi:hypothetical protein